MDETKTKGKTRERQQTILELSSKELREGFTSVYPMMSESQVAFVVLEEECAACMGSGEGENEIYGCENCSGEGKVLTDNGHKILDLVKRKLSPTPSGILDDR